MSIKLQEYIAVLLQSLSSDLFLNLIVHSNFAEVGIANSQDVSFGLSLAMCFLLSDGALVAGVVIMVIVLGLKYKTTNAVVLTKLLLNISTVFIYISFLINLFGLLAGFTYLSKYNLSLFENTYTFSLFSQLAKFLLLLIVSCLYVLFTSVYFSKVQSIELPLLIQIALVFCSIIVSSTNYALLLLSLEGFSLILYIMTTLGRVYGGVTAAVKYFAFGTLGSIFLFWGVVHFYTLVPSLTFSIIYALLQQAPVESAALVNSLEFATTAIAFGFMLKLGAAPMHQWVADVYAGSHMYITAFFSTFVKFLLFVVFLNTAIYFNCDALLQLFTVMSLAVGCILSIRQVEIKRLLAYSSVVHVGFMLMGDFTSSIIYLLTYITSTLLLFSVLLNSEIASKELVYLNDLRFVRKASYSQTLCLVTALASSAGLPPFAGFYGKFLIWLGLIEDLYLLNSTYSFLILFLSITISLVTIYYYMRLIAYLFISEDAHIYAVHLHTWGKLSKIHTLSFMQLALVILVLLWTFIQLYLLNITLIVSV
jgi:NADH-quinone oxidoreductase subunit N